MIWARTIAGATVEELLAAVRALGTDDQVTLMEELRGVLDDRALAILDQEIAEDATGFVLMEIAAKRKPRKRVPKKAVETNA